MSPLFVGNISPFIGRLYYHSFKKQQQENKVLLSMTVSTQGGIWTNYSTIFIVFRLRSSGNQTRLAGKSTTMWIFISIRAWLLFILVGGLNPSEKYESQLGWLFPIYGKIKNVPNHQPVIYCHVYPPLIGIYYIRIEIIEGDPELWLLLQIHPVTMPMWAVF